MNESLLLYNRREDGYIMNVDIRFIFCIDKEMERHAFLTNEIVNREGEVPDESELKINKSKESGCYDLVLFGGKYIETICVDKEWTHEKHCVVDDSIEFENLLLNSSFEKSFPKDKKYVDVQEGFDKIIFNKIVRLS